MGHSKFLEVGVVMARFHIFYLSFVGSFVLGWVKVLVVINCHLQGFLGILGSAWLSNRCFESYLI